MSRIPIRVRLTAWFVVVLATVLVALGSFVVTRLRGHLTGEVDRSLTATATDLLDAYRTEGNVDFDESAREAIAIPRARTLGAQIVDRRGTVVRSVGSDLMRTPLLAPATYASAPAAETFTASVRAGPSRTHLRMISVPIQGTPGRAGVLSVAEPLDTVDAAVRQTILLLLIGGAGALLLAGFGGWWIAGRAMRPVSRIATRADAIDIADLDQRVPVPEARDELNHLARTVNAMLERLQTGVAAREELIANASHELRGPLAAMRAELDVSLAHDDLGDEARQVLESLREEATRMGRIVDNLLTLARVDDGRLEILRATHDLHAIATGAMRSHRAAAQTAGVRLVVTGTPVDTPCDRDRVEQVLHNLIDNAIRVSPDGGAVTLDVRAQAGEGYVTVRDTGPGVPVADRERIFDRFTRSDPVRGRSGGAGLGLAISREIAHAHGGRLELLDTGPDGSTFQLVLPLGTTADSSDGGRMREPRQPLAPLTEAPPVP